MHFNSLSGLTADKQGCAQTVQYIQPHHCAQLAQAELLVIDEAAAIPLPTVRAMLRASAMCAEHLLHLRYLKLGW